MHIKVLKKRVEVLEFAITKVSPIENILNKIELINVMIVKANMLETIIGKVGVLKLILAKLLSHKGWPIELKAFHQVDSSRNGDVDKLKEQLESLVSYIETFWKLSSDITESHKSIGEAIDALTKEAKEAIVPTQRGTSNWRKSRRVIQQRWH